jgi:hypothetical protein
MAKIKNKINRKLIIAFLNAAETAELAYYNHNGVRTTDAEATPVEALVELINQDYSAEDVLLLFTTADAKSAPVCKRLKAKFVGGVFSFVIPQGKTEAEIVEICEIMQAQIETKDHITLLASSHFPLLLPRLLPFLSFCKFSKTVRLGEVLLASDVAGSKEKTFLSLDASDKLQAWVSAADIFLKDGSSSHLQILMHRIAPTVAEQFAEFALAITTVRGTQICYEFDFTSFKAGLKALAEQEPRPEIRFIIDKIAKKYEPFMNKKTANGIYAVLWCLQHDMVQQGYTFLQETLMSYLLDQVLGVDAAEVRNIFSVREIANEALKGKSYTELNFQMSSPKYRNTPQVVVQKIRQICQWAQGSELIPLYSQISGQAGLCNDMRHAGHQYSPSTGLKLKSKLESLSTKVLNLL